MRPKRKPPTKSYAYNLPSQCLVMHAGSWRTHSDMQPSAGRSTSGYERRAGHPCTTPFDATLPANKCLSTRDGGECRAASLVLPRQVRHMDGVSRYRQTIGFAPQCRRRPRLQDGETRWRCNFSVKRKGSCLLLTLRFPLSAKSGRCDAAITHQTTFRGAR